MGHFPLGLILEQLHCKSVFSAPFFSPPPPETILEGDGHSGFGICSAVDVPGSPRPLTFWAFQISSLYTPAFPLGHLPWTFFFSTSAFLTVVLSALSVPFVIPVKVMEGFFFWRVGLLWGVYFFFLGGRRFSTF